MEFGIRRATAADATALAELAAITFPLACPADSPAEAVEAFIGEHLNPEKFAAYLADPLRTIFVAQEGLESQEGRHRLPPAAASGAGPVGGLHHAG